MSDIITNLVVLGGGPGGYVAATRAAQYGIETVLIDKARLGGTCLNVGCIPSKALIHSAETYHEGLLSSRERRFGTKGGEPNFSLAHAIDWKDSIVSRLSGGVAHLLKRSKVEILIGQASLIDGKTVSVSTDAGIVNVRAEHVLIATGSLPQTLQNLPFGGNIISSSGALALRDLPSAMCVVGAGYIGLELGIAFAKLGVKVSIVEAAERLLPSYDAELTEPVRKNLKHLGIDLLTGCRAERYDGALHVTSIQAKAISIPCDKVLVAVGRKPCTTGFGIEKLDLLMDGKLIRVDSRCATSMRNVWAIGDVTGDPMLAHRAMAQGETVAAAIAGRANRFDPRALPAVCFTDPEIVSVGFSPEQATAAGHEIKTGKFPFSGNGRAMTLALPDGFVRVVARSDNHLVLGIQACGRGVSELSTAFGLALEMGATLEDVEGTIHSHPTLGEGLQEASFKALGRALHA